MRNVLFIGLFVSLAAISIGCKGNLKSSNCTPECSGKECGADGCGGICGACGPGFSCGTDGLCASSFCGNGRLDPSESCDFAIAGGNGVCESACVDDGIACTTQQFFGSPTTCDAECTVFNIRDCINDDGCCPDGCNTNDSDCSLTCGNGTVEPPLEFCDPPESCPTDAAADCPDDMDACTNNVIVGNAAACAAQCTTEAIEDCIDDDGCCPADCVPPNDGGRDEDNDCIFLCGDGQVTGPETCDNAIAAGDMGACPVDAAVDCDDAEACTTDTIDGMADDCTAACVNVAIVDPINGDGCCPPGATPANDDDCVAVCGNNVVEAGETCDNAIPAGDAGACPQNAGDCDDADTCTTDAFAGDPAQCTAECTNTDIMAPVAADGCCYFAGTVMDEITDCQSMCDDYCTQVTSFCTDAELGAGNGLFQDLNASGDAMDECQAACAAYTFTIRTPAGAVLADDDTFNTLTCRLYHLTLADPGNAGDPATHCPHAADVSATCANDP